ncbi:MAG: toxin-antitoxin system HicB family antitoxin [Alphaproteobacteria bacterium]|nr:toxin-antitoxin system HicB family antitoxin [Alphaproteobacteria bacterium]
MIRDLEYPYVIRPLSRHEGGGSLIVFPDLPGCASNGETPEQAVVNGADALRTLLLTMKEFGDPVPPSSWPEQIRSVAGVMPVWLPRGVTKKLVARAHSEGVSAEVMVVSLVAEGLAKAKPRTLHRKSSKRRAA